MDDSYFIQGLKKKKEKVLRQVIDYYGGYIYTIVNNILGDVMQPEDVEETVSDIFWNLWRYSKQLDKDRPLKPYLVSMARNAARNKLRAYHLTSPLEEWDAAEEDILCEQLEQKEQLAIVERTLQEFEPWDREIFLRYYFYYEKIHSIAERYQSTDSKVKMTLHRMRKRCKKRLEEHGYE